MHILFGVKTTTKRLKVGSDWIQITPTGKYLKQQEDWEQELKEKMEKFMTPSKIEEVSIDNHPILQTYEVSSTVLGK
jgi:hypothetical protein